MRVVSVWLQFWPTERLRRPTGAPPCATVLSEAGRRVLAAVDPAARRLGLRPGMTLAAAQAVLATLATIPADPAGEAAGLARLALWALRYAPLVAPAADGFWIDITGAAHLAGGEAALLADLVARLARFGLTARAAVADTPGAAWAVARYGEAGMVPPGGAAAALAPLPVAALRLDPPALALLE
ncbi:MAG: Y-family DNA polymerase, partial [Acetobacteraceae bacterium]